MTIKKLFFLGAQFCALSLFAQNNLSANIKKNIDENQFEIVQSFKELLTIPNLAVDPVNIERNAKWIATYMQASGIQNVQLLTANTKGVAPVVFGEVKVPGATETVIFYAHYDGQPVDSTKWFKGTHPFKPSLYSNMIDQGGVAVEWPIKALPMILNGESTDVVHLMTKGA